MREAVLLALPLAPLCGEDCLGPAPDRFPAVVEDGEAGRARRRARDGALETASTMPRWAALDELDLAERRRAPASLVRSAMAVPKKKTSKSKSRSRRASAWRLDTPVAASAPAVGSTKRPHVVCGTCGWYNGRQAVDVD